MNTTTSYSSFINANPQLVQQALQRYQPPPQQQMQQMQDQAPPPVQAQPQQVEQAQQPQDQVKPPDQQQQEAAIGHPDSNGEGVAKIADMIKSQQSGGDSGKGGSMMDTFGKILAFL